MLPAEKRQRQRLLQEWGARPEAWPLSKAATRLAALQAFVAVDEGASMFTVPGGCAAAQCVAAVLHDAWRRLTLLGGRPRKPRSLASPHGGSVIRFLSGCLAPDSVIIRSCVKGTIKAAAARVRNTYVAIHDDSTICLYSASSNALLHRATLSRRLRHVAVALDGTVCAADGSDLLEFSANLQSHRTARLDLAAGVCGAFCVSHDLVVALCVETDGHWKYDAYRGAYATCDRATGARVTSWPRRFGGAPVFLSNGAHVAVVANACVRCVDARTGATVHQFEVFGSRHGLRLCSITMFDELVLFDLYSSSIYLACARSGVYERALRSLGSRFEDCAAVQGSKLLLHLKR